VVILVVPSSPGGEELRVRIALIRLGVVVASVASLAVIVGAFRVW
jgi:hypothetical protein